MPESATMPTMAMKPMGSLVMRRVKMAPMRPSGPVMTAMRSLGISPSWNIKIISTMKIMIGTAAKMYFIDLVLHSREPSFASV